MFVNKTGESVFLNGLSYLSQPFSLTGINTSREPISDFPFGYADLTIEEVLGFLASAFHLGYLKLNHQRDVTFLSEKAE